ncbi:MAG: DUF211 domain-containing protein [Thermofilum sp.]
MPSRVVRVVLDVLKPRELPLPRLAAGICEHSGASQVTADIVEVDLKTETVKLTVEGEALDLDLLYRTLEEYGCAVRSTDSITVKYLPEDH